MEIVYSDNHLVVANKPHGIATQPDFEEAVRRWVFEEFGTKFLHAVHRLDKATAGLVLFARTKKALSRINSAMRDRAIKKTYYAEVEGDLHGQGRLVHHLVHGDHRAIVAPEGKEAVLTYEARDGVVKIVLETGRYHQIRAQLAAIGHPIRGDRKYGATEVLDHICLVHSELELLHPVTKVPLLMKIGYTSSHERNY